MQVSKSIIAFASVLLMSILINSLTVESVTASFQRSQIIGSISSILLLLIGFLWEKISPFDVKKVSLNGKEAFEYDKTLEANILDEIAWGSETILTATAAASILIYIDNKVILKRGIISEKEFMPGHVTKRVIDSQRKLSLSNTKFYPNVEEFEAVCNSLPSVITFPISNKGVLIVGGWSPSCFTKSDEKWIENWCIKISNIF